jgi:hypothetical protein
MVDNNEKTKASDIWTKNLYNLLGQLKNAYAQYIDMLSEMQAKTIEEEDDNQDEANKRTIMNATSIIRQSITLLEIEYKTLENNKKMSSSENLNKIRQEWQKNKKYLPDEQLLEEYILQLNTEISNQILNNIYTDVGGIYGIK